jgi:hypothetical protein
MARIRRYWSGEEVKAGDRITYGGVPGTVQFVVIDGAFDPVSESGQGWPTDDGVMINVPNAFGLILLSDVEEEEDLYFVSRGPASAPQDESD